MLLRDIARVELGPDERRGLDRARTARARWSRGIAMARYGQNALEVIHNLEKKIGGDRIGPAGRRVDRGRLRPFRADPPRHATLLKRTLLEESIIVGAGLHQSS